ncbi:MAG: ferredoxin family protein [Candidatus Bathyarchaeia archaeon]|jgi:NAD-dependent dihydropyrimidine dehydrogenase PreA subunit
MIVNVENEKCIGCSRCYEVCPLDVYTWDEQTRRPIVTYEEECQMCFICQEECPADAIHIRIPITFW